MSFRGALMNPDILQARQQAYLELLEHGLVAIRNHAHAGKIHLCEVEADHLHNLPSLLYETNEFHHHYYLDQERSLYRERLERQGEWEYLERMMIWYTGSWKVLETIAGQAGGSAEDTERDSHPGDP
jgi:hypothetical protein